jgi:hypothetical protein
MAVENIINQPRPEGREINFGFLPRTITNQHEHFATGYVENHEFYSSFPHVRGCSSRSWLNFS